jgi:RNA polymerase sigma-70 factor (ECF subfamily)
VYREHVQFVWRNARRLGCDESWADDAVHEVFLVVAERLHEFEARSSMRTWLFAITFRVVRRLRRNRSRYLSRLLRLADQAADSDQGRSLAREDAGCDLRRILGRLSEAKRAVYILAELEGMTTPEIAQGLGLKPGTVDSRLRAARLELSAWAERERLRERTT